MTIYIHTKYPYIVFFKYLSMYVYTQTHTCSFSLKFTYFSGDNYNNYYVLSKTLYQSFRQCFEHSFKCSLILSILITTVEIIISILTLQITTLSKKEITLLR